MQTDNNNTQALHQWEYSPHYKEYAEGSIFCKAQDRMIGNLEPPAATSQKQLNKDAEFICKAVNNYSKLVEENKRLTAQLDNTHKRMYAFLNEHDGLSDADYEILRDIEVSLLAAINNAKNL